MHEVRRLRQARGWNQTELAFHAGLAPSVISQIENGKRNPSARTLEKLATALDIEVGDLFPKAQAPLPLEEDQKPWGDPFLLAWTGYLRRRTRVWKQALPEEGEALTARPQFVFDALYRNELMQTEVTMLSWALFEAVAATVINDADMRAVLAKYFGEGQPLSLEAGQRYLKDETTLRDIRDLAKRIEERPELIAMREAHNRMEHVAAEWRVRAQAAWDVAGEQIDRREPARAKEAAERAMEERQNVVEMFGERRPA